LTRKRLSLSFECDLRGGSRGSMLLERVSLCLRMVPSDSGVSSLSVWLDLGAGGDFPICDLE
jgi:hypothetical protein